MEDAIRRAVERQFPELTGRYHLPRFGRVVAVPDAPEAQGLCDDFRPRFGVDVEVLLPAALPPDSEPALQRRRQAWLAEHAHYRSISFYGQYAP